MRTTPLLAGFSCLFLLGACGGGGGGGGSSLKLSAIDGTWRIESTVATSTGCATVGAIEVGYANFANTSGTIVEVADAEDPSPAVQTATAAERSVVWVGSGADAGDSFTITLDAGNVTCTGTAVELDDTVTPNCTTTYNVVGTKVVGAAAVASGKWEFQVTLDGSATALVFSDLVLQQRFASIRATNTTTELGGVLSAADLDGTLESSDGGGLAVTFVGAFSDSKTFAGRCQRTVGGTTTDGDIRGVWVSGGSASVCSSVDTASDWQMTVTSGVLLRTGTGAINTLKGLRLSKADCALDITWDSNDHFPWSTERRTFRISGSMVNAAYEAAVVGGDYFRLLWPDTTITFDGNFRGNPATSWTGTYRAVGRTIGSGDVTFRVMP